MAIATADPARFQRYREPLRATMVRTVSIALVLGTIGSIVQLGRVPGSFADAYAWLVLVVSVLWFSLGGHWVELAYLNGLRPRIARMPDRVLILVRLGIWLFGGTLLVLGMVTTYSVMTVGRWPGEAAVRGALLYGGAIFAMLELGPHAVLSLLGRPSFWNLRG